MGTRHLIAVVKDGEYKLANYGQWDGYLSGQGVSVLAFLRKRSLSKFAKQMATMVTPFDQEEYDRRLVAAGGDPKSEWINMEVSNNLTRLSPESMRDNGAKILDMIQNAREPLRCIPHAIDFAADSLFCEWAYVIDLDKGTFEVFKGFNEKPLADGERFKFLEGNTRNEYQPVKLLKSWPLDKLPSKRELLALDGAS